MPTIILSNGTEFKAILGFVAPYNQLELVMDQETALVHLPEFLDPEVMKEITVCYATFKNIYHGYNRFVNFAKQERVKDVQIWMAGNDESTVEEHLPV